MRIATVHAKAPTCNCISGGWRITNAVDYSDWTDHEMLYGRRCPVHPRKTIWASLNATLEWKKNRGDA